MSDNKNREFVRTLHGMIADFLRANPDIDRSYYQEIWDWLEKKENEESEDERIRKEILEFVRTRGGFKGEWIAYLDKQKERKPIINFPVFIEEKNIEQAIKKFLGESAKFQKEQTFTHHEMDESLQDAVTHQMEDDGDVDDFVRRGIDDIVLKYAEIGAKWQKDQKPVNWTELNGKDIAKLEVLINTVHNEYPNGIGQESFGEEVLERFREYKEDEYPDEKEQKPIISAEEMNQAMDDIHNFKVAVTDLAKTFNIRIDHDRDIDWHNFCAELLTYLKRHAEWSEEDKKTISFVIDILRANHPDGFFKTSPAGDIHVIGITTEDLVKKLNSLLSPPKSSGNWKPTEEQLIELRCAISGCSFETSILEELENQLKAL